MPLALGRENYRATFWLVEVCCPGVLRTPVSVQTLPIRQPLTAQLPLKCFLTSPHRQKNGVALRQKVFERFSELARDHPCAFARHPSARRRRKYKYY